MTVRIYAVSMGEPREEEQRAAGWLERVPQARAERIRRFRRFEDRWRSLAGDMLVAFVLQAEYGLNGDRLRIARDGFGKPFLASGGIHFNVSHAGRWVVAAFHEEPIGVDIERIAEADMAVAETLFAHRECEALRRMDGEARDRLFCAIWTGKESFAKADGRGLSLPLDAVVMGDARAEEYVARGPDGREKFLRRFALDPAYMLTVCAAAPEWPEAVARVAPELLDAPRIDADR